MTRPYMKARTYSTIDRLDRRSAARHEQRLDELRRIGERSTSDIRAGVVADLERLGRYRRVWSESPVYPLAA